MARFQVDMQVTEGKTPLISVLGDIETPGWEQQLIKGVDELLQLVSDIYGAEVVQKGLERHFK